MQAKKRFLAILLVIPLLLSLVNASSMISAIVDGYSPEGTLVYSDDFSSNTKLLSDWSGNSSSFAVDNGALNGTAGFKGIMHKTAYENFVLDTSVNANIRIVFRANGSMWLADRYYVEVDFGGAVYLRNGTDAQLAVADVGFNSGTFNRIIIKADGSNVKIYVNNGGTPVIDYTGLTITQGNLALMTTTGAASLDFFKVYDLDAQSVPVYEPEGTLVYSDEFSDSTKLAGDWSGDVSFYTVTSGALNGAAGFKGIMHKTAYKNFVLDTSVKSNTRIVFRANGSMWLADRYYVEVDFGGAVYLRNGTDAQLAVADVGFNSGTFNRIIIKADGSNVKIYVNNGGTPVIDYTGITITQGNLALMTTTVAASLDFFKVYDLDAQSVPAYEPEGTLVYSDEFSDSTKLASDWSGDVSFYSVTSGALNGATGFKGIMHKTAYKNFVLDTSVKSTTRIVFRANGSMWLADRYYVEVDFGGAVHLRNGTDAQLATAEVSFNAGTFNRIIIKANGNNVKIYVNNGGTPVIDYTGLTMTQGNLALMTTTVAASLDFFKVYDLDAQSVPAYEPEGTLVYSDEFSDSTKLAGDWSGDVSSYSVTDGALLGETGFKGIMLKGTYKNFVLDTSVKSNTRIVFRANQNMWLPERYYIEVDISGAIYLRDGNDVTLASSDASIVANEYNRLMIKANGNTLTVYLNQNGIPVINYEGLTLESGNFGIMSTNSIVNYDYFRIYDLDGSGTPPTYEPEGALDYSDDFSDTAKYKSDWVGTKESYSITDGALTGKTDFKGIMLNRTYQNFVLDTSVNTHARIIFRADGNIYLRNRYYLEVDFGGALLLRSGTDKLIASANATLNEGQNNRVVIKVNEGRIQVYLNNNGVPALDYDGLVAAKGNIGLLTTIKDVSFDYLNVYRLPDTADGGVINPVNLIDAPPVNTAVRDKKIAGYFTDFSSKEKVYEEWYSVQEFYVENGFLKSTAAVSGAFCDVMKFTNFEIESVCNNSARFVFGLGGSVIWTSDKYYIEVDFAGAIKLCNSADTEIKVVYLPAGTLNIDENARIRIRVVGNDLKVYINEIEEPVFEYNNLSSSTGYVGLMTINKDTSFSHYSIASLDKNGNTISYSENIRDDGKSADTGDLAHIWMPLLFISILAILGLYIMYSKQRKGNKG